jgi:hypothetical protein
VDAGGNVGVKTASPSTDFEVVGNAKATTITIGSSAALTGVATDAEAIAGTSTTLAVAPHGVADAINRRLARRRFQTNLTVLSTQSTGTGAGYTQVQQYTNIAVPTAGIAGFTRGFILFTSPDANLNTNFSNKLGFGIWTRVTNHANYSGLSVRSAYGYPSGPTAGVVLGDLTTRGFGWTWTNGENLFLQVHDGTTLHLIDTLYTPTSSTTAEILYLEAFSDGQGNVTGYVEVKNGTTVVTYTVSSANGPTGTASILSGNGWLFQAAATGAHLSQLNFGGPHPTYFYD